MAKMNDEGMQNAFDYVLFMISSSYFEKQPVNQNTFQEKRLFCYYKDVSSKIQIEMEHTCIRYVEKELSKIVPESFWNQESEYKNMVYMVPDEENGVTEIIYETEKNILRLKGKYNSSTHRAEFDQKYTARV